MDNEIRQKILQFINSSNNMFRSTNEMIGKNYKVRIKFLSLVKERKQINK